MINSGEREKDEECVCMCEREKSGENGVERKRE